MNFTTYMNMPVRGHAEIDFVDVHIDGDNRLYIDPERIALSDHPYAHAATEAIEDYFAVLCQAAAAHDDDVIYHLLSFGREPNETHLGLSTADSRGRGTTPEIMMPIVQDMIDSGMFEAGLVTQLSDLHIWTPNFHYDRLSDLTTNIIRAVLADYTYSQYDSWRLQLPEEWCRMAPAWDVDSHEWGLREYPHFMAGDYPTLLVPKPFVGRRMLSSPGELLQKYALRYRQQEHLDERTDFCHCKVKKNGDVVWTPPTKRELYNIEVKADGVKKYLQHTATTHPGMIRELHEDNRGPMPARIATMSDSELDSILYSQDDIAV